MKKIFKIIISAIICIALALVPMTVMAEEGITYNISDSILVEGTNTYTLDSTVPYTVFKLNPTAVGDFTIVSNDCVMGIVSYLDMWVQFEPTEENVNLNEINWSCTDVNQAIMVGIKSDLSEVSITITREESSIVEIPWIIYENIKTPEKFEMPDFVNVDAFEDGYVDFEDSTIDDAVLGDDGYYHLNEKNGPILFANLNDTLMSLYNMSSYGSMVAVHYDDDDNVIEKTDYTDAFYEYIAALPTNSSGVITSYYYPLTADLIEIFKEVGTSNNWYSGDEAWVYDSEDAWLYACYFDDAVTTMDPADYEGGSNLDGDTNAGNDNNNQNTNNSTGNTSNDNSNTNTDTSNKAPATGDNNLITVYMVIIITAFCFMLNVKKITE